MADDGYWKREQTAIGRLINNVINTALDAKDWLMTAFGMEPAAELAWESRIVDRMASEQHEAHIARKYDQDRADAAHLNAMHPVDRDRLLNYYAGDQDRFRSVPIQVVEDELRKDQARWVANHQPENKPGLGCQSAA